MTEKLATPTFTIPQVPDKLLVTAAGGGLVPLTSAYTPTTLADAQGRVPENGLVAVVCDIANNLTMRLWCSGAKQWVYPGTSTQYTQAFTGAYNMQYFSAYPGSEFYLSSDTANVHAWVKAGNRGLPNATSQYPG